MALDEALLTRLEIYYRLLSRWNTKINLTALPLEDLTDHAVDRLLIEPLAAARFVPESPLTWFDLGSGGGSPALPLKLVRPPPGSRWSNRKLERPRSSEKRCERCRSRTLTSRTRDPKM